MELAEGLTFLNNKTKILLPLELERHGFTLLEQNGAVTENAIWVHQSACLAIS